MRARKGLRNFFYRIKEDMVFEEVQHSVETEGGATAGAREG